MKVQKKAAQEDYACPVLDYEEAIHYKCIFGYERSEQLRFHNVVMQRMAYSLDDKMKSNLFFDVDTAQKVAAQMLLGIKSIHKTGYVHGDIKPSNLMFQCKKKEEVERTVLKYINFGSVQQYFDAGKYG
jgi:serine/threonine protein kinase